MTAIRNPEIQRKSMWLDSGFAHPISGLPEIGTTKAKSATADLARSRPGMILEFFQQLLAVFADVLTATRLRRPRLTLTLRPQPCEPVLN
jgi:hypothetical protein